MASSLMTQTFHGFPLGINQALPAHEIPIGSAVWIQDALLDKAGEVRQRGPVKQSADVGFEASDDPQGLIQMLADDGTLRIAWLVGTTTPKLEPLSTAFNSGSGLTWSSQSWSTPPIWQARPALKGGTLIGTAQSPLPTAAGALGIWRGASKPDYSTGTLTSTRGSVAVTGSSTIWSTNVEPGMFLFTTSAGQRTLIGEVAKVVSNTSITLKAAAFATSAGATYLASSFRGLSARVGKGRITTVAGDATVLGAGTKFNMMSVLGETWNLFRASDLAFIGTVSTITNDRALELTASASTLVANEAYIAIRLAPTANFSVNQAVADEGLGVLTSTYSGVQFYANLPLPPSVDTASANLSSRVWFSELHDPEAVDLSPADGDFFDVTSQGGGNTPILAIIGLQNALAILKESELYALYGSDASTFQLRKIADVGTISPMAVQQYKNGIIFPGREGIYYFDGTNVQELTKALGQFYRDGLFTFNTSTDRAYGAIFHNHYLVSFTKFVSDYSPTRGSQATTIASGTLVMNMDTGGISWFTNLPFKGWINLPPTSGFNAWILAKDSSDGHAIILDANQLWSGTGPDTIVCSGEVAGPNFYVEMRKFDVGDPQRLKSFRQLAMHYQTAGDTLNMDIVPGLNEDGTTARTPWVIQTAMKNSRLQFSLKDTHVAFRIYPTNNRLASATLATFAIGFKQQRVGRT